MPSNTMGLFIVGAIATIVPVGILAELIKIRQILEDKHGKKK